MGVRRGTAGTPSRPSGDRADAPDPRAPGIRATAYRWRPGVWKARRAQRSGTPIPARVASHGPITAWRRAYVHGAARSRARVLSGRTRHTGDLDSAAGGNSLSIDGRGLLVIISAPSGAGKDTVIHRLVKELDDAVVYVTATSRKPRRGEQPGIDSYFYEPEKFRAEA